MATDIDTLRDHLHPLQLAVGVKAGAEAMQHLARQWCDTYAGDADGVLINYDETKRTRTTEWIDTAS